MECGTGIGDTIAALATGRGRSGIGIVKISGDGAVGIARRVFRPRRGSPTDGPGDWPRGSHRLWHGWVHAVGDGHRIDEALVGVMRGPHSYTGEDVVEINAHGGAQVLTEILENVIAAGARMAEPGEFTRRAFLNGRLDLSQAEAVVDLIDARSRTAARAAGRNLEGRLGRKVREIRQRLVDALARIDAGIDFGDEVGEGDPEAIRRGLRRDVLEPLEALMENQRRRRAYMEGVRIAVVGRPNVGKSSIVNRMIDEDRVIVTDQPGTTRDLVDVSLHIGELPVVVTDTAGLHESRDAIESLGMEKTRACLDRSDLVLFVIDAGQGVTQEDDRIRQTIGGRDTLIVFNKMDLLAGGDRPGTPENWPGWGRIGISAKFDERLDGLERAILERIEIDTSGQQEDLVPNLRQAERMAQCCYEVEQGLDALAREGEELAVIDLQNGRRQLDDILGEGSAEDVLDAVFQRFCIGK